MKKNSLYFLLMCISIILSTNLISCSDDEGGDYECETSDVGYGTFKACCNATKCYLEYDGKTYQCDGLNCNDAIDNMVDDMVYGINAKKIDDCDEEVLELKNQILITLSKSEY